MDQVRNYSVSHIILSPRIRMSTECVRREAISSGELNQAITLNEWIKTEGNRAGSKLEIFELGAALEYALTNSFEVFVTDAALEGGAIDERPILDDLELIGESDIRESVAVCECCLS